MKRVFAVVLGVFVLGLTAGADDADNAKKIVGKWEVSKSGSDLPKGSTVEFTKDNKLNVVFKDNDKETKIDGTYTVAKDKLTVKLKAGDQTVEETVTIQKLTDKVLELKDKDGKVDELSKK